MSIPLATTKITIRRPSLLEDSDIDPWEREDVNVITKATESTVASGVRAVISPSIGRSAEPGDTETIEFRLACDPTDLTFRDKVLDESTQKEYDVTWALSTPGIAGLSHVQAGLVTVTGLGNE